MRTLIFSSYYHPTPSDDWFYPRWKTTICRGVSSSNDVRFFTLCQAGKVPIAVGEHLVNTSDVPTLGVVKDLPQSVYPFYTGAISSLMTGLWIAYNDERDFIYIEQDVLPFGNWFERLYEESDGFEGLFMRCRKFDPMGGTMAFFMVRHQGIPIFTSRMIQQGPERGKTLVEYIPNSLITLYPDKYRWSGMGVDRDRPFNVNNLPFFIHKATPSDMRVLSEAGLMDIRGMPDGISVFSNRS